MPRANDPYIQEKQSERKFYPNGRNPQNSQFKAPHGSNTFLNTRNSSAMDVENVKNSINNNDNVSMNSDNFSVGTTDLQGEVVQKNQFFNRKNNSGPYNNGNNNANQGKKNSNFRANSKIIDMKGFNIRVNFRNIQMYDARVLASISNHQLFIIVPGATLEKAVNDRLIDNINNQTEVNEFKKVCKTEGMKQAPLVYKSVLHRNSN